MQKQDCQTQLSLYIDTTLSKDQLNVNASIIYLNSHT